MGLVSKVVKAGVVAKLVEQARKPENQRRIQALVEQARKPENQAKIQELVDRVRTRKTRRTH